MILALEIIGTIIITLAVVLGVIELFKLAINQIIDEWE
jgi:hypothetical protein